MTHIKQLGVAIVAALAVLSGESAVRAQVIHTDQGAFLAQVAPGYNLETFDALPQFTVVSSPLSFSAGGFSYTASTEPILQDFFPAGPPGDTWLSTNAPSDDIVFDFTSGNVTAVGGVFFRTDPAGEVATAGTITLALDNGTVYSVDTPSANTFVGFTTTSPILSLSVGVEPVGGFLEDFATANDLIVGVAVPEPSTLVLAGLALGWRLVGRFSSQRER
jgi:hypothetical protein